MKIEQMKLTFMDHTLEKKESMALLHIPKLEKKFQISPLQASYLEYLKNELSIEGLFSFFIRQGWLLNFKELYSLLKFSADIHFITNSDFVSQFNEYGLEQKNSKNDFSEKTQKTSAADFSKVDFYSLPFLRSLNKDVVDILKQDARLFNIPANQRFIKSGDHDRTLYIILKGEVALYRVHGPQQRTLLTKIGEKSLIGEGSFLLNNPRSADAITLCDSVVLAIPYTQKLDGFLNSSKAESLQHRFWILQALQSSAFFNKLPSETIDQLVFAGKLFKTKEQQLLFQQGQSSRSCFILVQGKVRVVKDQKTINILPSGTCFGEISLLISGGVRTASVYSEVESLLLEIPLEAFYKVMSQNIFLAKEIEELAVHRLENDRKRAS